MWFQSYYVSKDIDENRNLNSKVDLFRLFNITLLNAVSQHQLSRNMSKRRKNQKNKGAANAA